MFKKILCLLTALLLMLTMVACDSGDDDVETEETSEKPEETTKAEVEADFDWTLSSDGTYYIVSGIGTVTDKEVKIPAEYKGLPVKEIGDKAFSGSTATSFEIPSSITKIGNYAFAGCKSMKEIFIPASVTVMGHHVFNQSNNSLDILIEASSVPPSWNGGWREGAKGSVTYDATNTGSSNNGGGSSSSTGYSEGLLYGGNYELTVLGIGTCTDTDIVIPAEHNGMEVVAIAEEAFKNCTSVKSIKIPDSVTSIGYAAFSGCSSLESLTMPWVMEIKTGWSAAASGLLGYAFGRTEYTGGVNIVQNYDDGSTREIDFYIPATLKSVTVIKDQVWSKSVGSYAFYGCTMLESVTLPDEDASIGDRMFFGCTSLKTVNIPSDVTMIGDHAFYNCTSLQSITLPSTLKTIDYGAFNGCTALTSLSLPSAIEKIWDSAFRNCSSLTGTITLPSTVEYVGNTAFDGCGYTHIYVNTSLTDIDIYWGSDWNGDIPFGR